MKLQFNPCFQLFSDSQHNVLLNSQSNEVVLDAKNYPLFSYLCDVSAFTDLNDIIKCASPNELALFYYQVENLKKCEWLSTAESHDNDYQCFGNMIGSSSFNKHYSIPWHSTISSLETPCTLVERVDALKNNTLTLPTRVIEIYKQCVYVSPLIASNEELLLYQNLLNRNRPVDVFMNDYGIGKSRLLTYPSLPSKLAKSINKLSEVEALVIELHSKKSSTCSLSALLLLPEKVNNRPSKIALRNIKITYSKDGGSRTCLAQQTINKLKPFIHQQFGYVLPLKEISDPYSNVKIFSSGYYKSPKKVPTKISGADFIQKSLGKGVTEEQSKASALCEAIERKNAQYCGNEQYVTKQAKDLPYRYISFDDISPYSDTQYQNFSNESHSDSRRKQAAVPYSHNEKINWQLVWSLTSDEAVYVPSVLCFANTPFHDDIYGKWNSNGCAAGNNLEEAILQALFELIERDATAIWWYNKLERPSFDLTRLDPDYLNPLHQTLNKDHDYWVLDLTVDTGVPVMAAIGRHKQNKGLIFGFGCHLKPEMAAQRALTELCQLIPIRNQNGAPFDFDAIELQSYLFANDQAPRGVYALSETLDIKDDILAVVEQLKCLNLETLALDYTRPPIPIHTAKVFVPGLCHIWPQLGNARLYQTPVKLGWLDEPLNEQTINQQGLYI
ncbi:bacteriocin biosynthesis protein [Pseudoalteromonas aurantia]|uniref:YcaO-like family protein n=1 Tax=Pseudoalteromonas aurantia TaxID=43654 RepID=UPI00110B7A03|nr:YcaO-like family protein [Pseudoalteromonas aurantia]TMO60457.1 bacteriocin biosynthesis protein [Pseudoalteromonas aurantia]